MTKKILLFITLFINAVTPLLLAMPVRAAVTPQVFITEIQTREYDFLLQKDMPQKEFIEIANMGDEAIEMRDWTLEYMPGTYDGTKPGTTLIAINGILPAGAHAIFVHPEYYYPGSDGYITDQTGESSGKLARTAGHVRLLNQQAQVIDCLSWGSAKSIEGCSRLSAVAPDGFTLQRPQITDGVYDLAAGLQNIAPPSPRGGGLQLLHDENPDNMPDQPSQTEHDCSVVQLSEVLPNPAGSDAEGEYIELYNPTEETVSLVGCSLRINTKSFVFSAQHSMASGEYRAFYITETGLQLPNGGTEVWLQTPTVHSSLTYPTSADDQLWSFIGGAWQTTFQATPNAPNILQTKGDVSSLGGALAATLESCPEGKERNPETNRCRNIVVPVAPADCQVGQERNPETNRCRKISATTSAQTPCAPGQERNPETGRCRKIATASSPTPCAPGQERNPETGRCRKVTSTTAKNNSDQESSGSMPISYKILIAILVLVTGYAVYEYRQEIAKLFRKTKRVLHRAAIKKHSGLTDKVVHQNHSNDRASDPIKD